VLCIVPWTDVWHKIIHKRFSQEKKRKVYQYLPKGFKIEFKTVELGFLKEINI